MPSIEMYGPRAKLLLVDRGEFMLLLDSFDDATETSAIVILTLPRAQLEEWVEVFGKALRGEKTT
jgi:hypothetical protein